MELGPQTVDSEHHKGKTGISRQKLLILISGIIAFTVIAVLITVFVLRSFQVNSGKQQISNEDVLLSQPLTDLSGIIEAISDNTLIISAINLNLDASSITTDTPPIAPQSQKTDYKVKITPQTEIKMTPVFIPYSTITSTPSATPVKSSDLKTGQQVNVVTIEDLRNPPSGGVNAVSITVSPGLVMIQGIIEEFSDNKLSVKAYPPSVPQEKVFKFTINDSTEISNTPESSTPSATRKSPLPTSRLEKNTEVIVYSDRDINISEDITALVVQIVSYK